MPQEDVAMEEPQTPSQKLTNDDFRKLLMTPRSASSGSTHAPGSIREAMANASTTSKEMPPPSERFEARRKKKNFYAALKKQEDTKLMELAEKYRDRARERRDNSNPDYTREDIQGANSAYRAVAPDIKSGMDAAERRRQQIQESKFLGGDMEHTHLVKGLDYALLQKVRSEIVTKEQEQEIEMEKMAEQAEEKAEEEKQQKLEEPEYKTAMGKNIFNTLQFYRSRHIQRNELFAPGRMAYIIELEDENAETDIPTTLIRSKADVPVVQGEIQTLTTNDIVINKLAQILSYLRQGGRGKKNKKRDKDKPLLRDSEYDQEPEYGRAGTSRGVDKYRDRDSYRDRERERDSRRYEKKRNDDVSIYDDVGDYKPSTSRRGGEGNSKPRGDDNRRDYFDKSSAQEELEAGGLSLPPPPKISGANLIAKLSSEPEGYAECYPGLQEMNDAIDDSDDEVDYTKMDLGNKKGPIGRWDFDTQEEYSDYMSTKEALPKAAFQYGVKMQDGRKTRKNKTEKNEKAELDREWQKIQNIIHKKKNKGAESRDADEPDYKRGKY